jgi:hypothetical protein
MWILLLLIALPVILVCGFLLLLALGYAIDIAFLRDGDHLSYFNLDDEDIP